jgi:hypothetical protein
MTRLHEYTLQELGNNIRHEIPKISVEEHQKVNIFRSFVECIRSGQPHLQHLL